MVRKVKGGSSARPRLKNEAMPASVTAAMMKTMKERCFSAQSERLRPLTKSLRAAGPSGPDAAPGRPPSPPRRRARAPDEITAVAGSKRCTSTLRSATVRFCGSTTHTAGCRSVEVSALAGIEMPAAALELQAPGHRRAEAHGLGMIDQAEPDLERAGDRIGLRRDRPHARLRGHRRVVGERDGDRSRPAARREEPGPERRTRRRARPSARW